MKVYLFASIFAGALAQMPAQLNATITDAYLVSVPVSIQGWDPQPFLINNHANRTLAWTQSCQQTSSLASNTQDVNCTAAPTLVLENLDTSNLTLPTGQVSRTYNGYSVSGVSYKGDLSLQYLNGSSVDKTGAETITVD